MNTLITFEDHGQDFLQWLVDKKGQLIDCQPFQYSIWSKYEVKNLSELKVGKFVEIGIGNTELEIKYPIEAIEKTDYEAIPR